MRRLLFVVLAAAAVSSTAHAQDPSAPTPASQRSAASRPIAAHGLLTGIDVMSATVLQEGQSSFSGLGLRARLHPERLVAGVEILPSVEYWRNSSTVTPYNIRATRKDATLGVDARYGFQYRGWNPYVGAGLGLHFLSSEVNAPSLGLTSATNSVVKGGLAALVGTTFELTHRVDNFIELKYHHIPDYKQLKINWGLAVKL
jgi:opacity protein-like surface antigen